jgi:hypothetical protein
MTISSRVRRVDTARPHYFVKLVGAGLLIGLAVSFRHESPADGAALEHLAE